MRVCLTYIRSLVQQGSNPSNFARPIFMTKLRHTVQCLCASCKHQLMLVLFREMSRKMTMPCSNLLTIKHAELIWFVHQQDIVKMTSIKLLSYKVTVKHFTSTHIIFEFCHSVNFLMKNPRKCLSEYNY